jgi:chromosomal replication initiation ATPase DnaA
MKTTPTTATKTQLDQLLHTVASYYSLFASDLVRKVRTKEIMHARQVFCYLAMAQDIANSAQLGGYLDVDHSTVLHGKEVIAGLASVQKSIRTQLDNLTQQWQLQKTRPQGNSTLCLPASASWIRKKSWC